MGINERWLLFLRLLRFRACVACPVKCRLIADRYPLAYRAKPLVGDGCD